ncbi:MAG: CU044_2847 family protein [Streptosporangiaceae bacterium]
MSYVIEVPVVGGGVLKVQAADADLPPGLELAALRPGEVVARASESLDSALDQLRPALDVIRRRLEALAPDEVSVEFGIVLGAETGVVVAKGTTEVHFTISPEVGRRR